MNPGVLLCALEREIAPVRRLFTQHRPIANARCPAWHSTGTPGKLDLVCCGMGEVAVTDACAWALNRNPPFVLLAGFSGGLHPDLNTGQLVVAAEVRDSSGAGYPISLPLEIPAAWRGPILTMPEIVYRAEEKHALHIATRTLAVDMESAGAARMCCEVGIPFASIRVISDRADQNLPRELATILKGERLQIRSLLWALFRRPGLLWDLLGLAQTTRHSATALCHGLQTAFRCLPLK